MAKHHIVQGKYLAQWRKSGTENQLNIYVIEENQIIERGPGWKGFWREDYNVLEDEGEKSYLPEDVTAIIDSKGIEAISCIAFYVALQYTRKSYATSSIDTR